jgi:hypothetical protein
MGPIRNVCDEKILIIDTDLMCDFVRSQWTVLGSRHCAACLYFLNSRPPFLFSRFGLSKASYRSRLRAGIYPWEGVVVSSGVASRLLRHDLVHVSN